MIKHTPGPGAPLEDAAVDLYDALVQCRSVFITLLAESRVIEDKLVRRVIENKIKAATAAIEKAEGRP